jgi:glycosyltransferase involved in cell wall biosynthesis
VAYFLRWIWPEIRKAAPEAVFKVTGKVDGVDISRLPLDAHAQLAGYQADIRAFIANSWACVVPLRTGGGTRLKILEAMAVGTPVISTEKGAEGLAVTPGEDILIADTAADFAAQTVRLLGDPELRRRLAQNGRRLVEARYNWERIGGQFVNLVEEIGSLR